MKCVVAVCQLFGAYPDALHGELSLASRVIGDPPDAPATVAMRQLAAQYPSVYRQLSREFREGYGDWDGYGRQQARRIDYALDRCLAERPTVVLLIAGALTAECLDVIDKYTTAFVVVAYVEQLNKELRDALPQYGGEPELQLDRPAIVVRGEYGNISQQLNLNHPVAAAANEDRKVRIRLVNVGTYDNLTLSLDEGSFSANRLVVRVQFPAGGIAADIETAKGRVVRHAKPSAVASVGNTERITLVTQALELREILVIPGVPDNVLGDAAGELVGGSVSRRTTRHLDALLDDEKLAAIIREPAERLRDAVNIALASQQDGANESMPPLVESAPALSALVIPVPAELPGEVLYNALDKRAEATGADERALSLIETRKHALRDRVRRYFLSPNDVDVAHAGYTWVFYAALGSYGDEAKESLPRQLTVLRTLGQLAGLPIELVYRFSMRLDSATNGIMNQFEVTCRVRQLGDAHLDSNAVKEAEAFARLVHTVMHSGYAIKWGDRPSVSHFSATRAASRATVRFAMKPWAIGHPSPDWGLRRTCTAWHARSSPAYVYRRKDRHWEDEPSKEPSQPRREHPCSGHGGY